MRIHARHGFLPWLSYLPRPVRLLLLLLLLLLPFPYDNKNNT